MESLPDIRAVIFDMDGVLTDSEPLISAAAVAMFKEKGLVVQPADFLPFVGTGEDRYIGGVAEKYGFQLDLPEAKRRTYEIYLELVPGQLRAFPGAVELVRACRSVGLKIAVASSADRVKVRANLEQIGLPESQWDAVITGEDVAIKKPAPDIFLLAAERVGVHPASCVVIEDAVNGVQAARNAGMRCVAVAQSFAAELLAGAHLVRERISAVTLEDLVGKENLPANETGGSMQPPPLVTPPPLPCPSAPEPSPVQHWGFWATLGLGVLMALAWMGVQGFVALAFVGVAQAGGIHMGRTEMESNGLLLSLAATAGAPIPFLFSWVFMRARNRSGIAALGALGFRRVRIRIVARWALGLALLILISDLVTVMMGRPIVPDVMLEMYATAGFPALLWLALIVAAPLAEEVLFRGFLLEGWSRSGLGPFWSVVLTSLLWAVIHMQYDAYGIGTIFVSGLLLGWSKLKTGSLWTPLVLHAFMNLVATLETSLLQ